MWWCEFRTAQRYATTDKSYGRETNEFWKPTIPRGSFRRLQRAVAQVDQHRGHDASQSQPPSTYGSTFTVTVIFSRCSYIFTPPPQSDPFIQLFETLDDLRPEDGPTTEIMAGEKFGTNVRCPVSRFDLSYGTLTQVLSLPDFLDATPNLEHSRTTSLPCSNMTLPKAS